MLIFSLTGRVCKQVLSFVNYDTILVMVLHRGEIFYPLGYKLFYFLKMHYYVNQSDPARFESYKR